MTETKSNSSNILMFIIYPIVLWIYSTLMGIWNSPIGDIKFSQVFELIICSSIITIIIVLIISLILAILVGIANV